MNEEKTPHLVKVCVVPGCGGELFAGKNPDESWRGFRYREKTCAKCGKKHTTKQPPEELTGVCD